MNNKLNYKVGDRVRIKNFDWFRNEGANNMVVAYMKKYYGEVVTIKSVHKDFYRIKEDDWQYCWTDEMIECKVEEKIKPKFKVGDKVRIKSLDWYNENKDEDGDVPCSVDTLFVASNKKYLGTIQTIERVFECKGRYTNNYIYHMTKIDSVDWTDEMIEGLAEEENGTALNPVELKSNANCITQNEVDVIEKAKTYWDSVKDAWVCPEGYQFKDENGNVINATKIILEKKKKEYPKTFLECCDVLGIENLIERGVKGYKSELFDTLQKLYICRDAYWKLYGDEMGLGKFWEPDWREERYIIYWNQDDIIGGYREAGCVEHHIFEFPTAEMRDAFKENFKVEIEMCKELL